MIQNDDWDTIELGSMNSLPNSTIMTGATGAISNGLIDWSINTSSGLAGSGMAGQIYTTTGTGGLNWATISADTNLNGHTLDVKGNANFEGDVKIKGKSINDSLERIEERLAILRPNEELESKWDNLRALRKAYLDLEAEIIEKEKIWKILKK